MKQCQEILASEANGEIFLHCMGNAIKRGITLALKLVQESNNGLGYEANTSTIDLIGRFDPSTIDWLYVSSCDLFIFPFMLLQMTYIHWMMKKIFRFRSGKTPVFTSECFVNRTVWTKNHNHNRRTLWQESIFSIEEIGTIYKSLTFRQEESNR